MEQQPEHTEPDDKGDFPLIAHHKKRAFLSAYAVVGTVTGAAKTTGISRRSHSSWMKNDANYAAAFVVAEQIAADALEQEARRRAIEGVMRPVLYKGVQVEITDPQTGQPAPLFEHEYSDTLLIFMLKGAKPDKYGDKAVWEQIARIKQILEEKQRTGAVRTEMKPPFDWEGYQKAKEQIEATAEEKL